MNNSHPVTETQKDSESEQLCKDQVRIEVIDDEKAFYEMKEEWNDLAGLAGVPVYVSFDWLSCWWNHFGRHPKRNPYIITAYYDDQLIGIAPFYKGESSLGPLILQRRLHLMGSGVSENELLGFIDDYGYSDFLDVIAHPDFEQLVADSVVDILLENKVKADVVCLQHVNDESFVVREILSRLNEHHLSYDIKQIDECPFISLPGSMETYMNEIGSSSRRRRFRKNLNPAGKKYEVEEVSTLENVRKSVDLLHSLHQERWQALGYPGLFFDTRYYRFFKDISELAFKNGWLWFKKAKDEEGYAAIRWTLKYNNRFFDCTSGFDVSSPSSKYSPGLGLLAILIDDAVDMNVSRIELLRGTERYKFDFTTESLCNWRISLPLYREKSAASSFLNMLVKGAGKLFAILENEINLLRVHHQKAGLLKMVYSYGSFRLRRLKSKLEDMNIFPKKINTEFYGTFSEGFK